MPLKRLLSKKQHASFYSDGNDTSYYKSLCCIQKDTTSLEQDVLDFSILDDHRPNTMEDTTHQDCSAENTNPLLLSWLAALEPCDPFHEEADDCEFDKNEDFLSQTVITDTTNSNCHKNSQVCIASLPDNQRKSIAKRIQKLIKKIRKLRPQAKHSSSVSENSCCSKTKK